ncbi:MAG TPA: SIS domain-containing protein [Acidimicrobiia bacterium]|nr:SIS domain-containing protein [Acidimicrobiia bacterium]
MNAATEFDRRVGPGSALSAEAGAIANACADMAARFHAGGKLVVFGNGAGATDAAHVAVEFVHPVIVGKRALPALSLSNDAAALTGLAERHGLAGIYAAQLALVADSGDIALGICGTGPVESVLRGLAEARRLGLLTVALTGRDPGGAGVAIPADHLLRAESDDPRIVKEIHVTMYHVLWELVHVFLEQPAVLAGRGAQR